MDDVKNNNDNKKSCFIITPIGGEDEPIRREIEGVIDTVITPVIESHGYDKPTVAHKIVLPGSINNQIIEHIVNDDLVIVNLTDLNPNVMYELAIRHATKKAVIHICQKNTNLPFDIKLERTITYTNDIMGASELAKSLNKFIEMIQTKDVWDDNPIYTGVRSMIYKNPLIDVANEREGVNQNSILNDSMSLILNRLDHIEYRLESKITSNTLRKVIPGSIINYDVLNSSPNIDLTTLDLDTSNILNVLKTSEAENINSLYKIKNITGE